MKTTQLALFAIAATMLVACSSDENNGGKSYNPADALSVKEMVGDFGVGQLSVSTASYKYSTSAAKGMRRVLAGYSDCSSFAAKAGALSIPAAYVDATEPEVPADAVDLATINPYAWPTAKPLVAGQSYYIDANYSNYNYLSYGSGEAGDVTIYIKEGVDIDASKINLADWTKAKIVVLKGATLTTSKSAKQTKNYGTLVQNGIYQQAGQELLNYGTIACSGTIQVEGTLYSATDLDALVKGAGAVYVGGNFNAQDGFGLAGSLYVGGDMTGHINIQNGLAAHVAGNVATEGIAKISGSQMMVDGDFAGTELQLNAGSEPQLVVKGSTVLTGNCLVANGAKGYFELIECENYTANASDIWVGCKSIVNGKFHINGNSKFTLANGVYLQVNSAEFASNTKMNMMSQSFFNVTGELAMHNVGDVVFNGMGDETAVVKCNTLAANFEDFSESFVGNVGVDFEAWNYNGSTGLIDQNKNLPDLKKAAEAASIPQSDCNPGYNTDKKDSGNTDKKDEPTVDPVESTCDLAINLPVDIAGEWIIQADDFAIHNGDILYESIATDKHSAGSELNSKYVLVTADDNVVVTLTDLCAMYEEYKGATNAEGKPYVSSDGILTIETYLWPAKKYYSEAKGCDVIEPISAEEFGSYPDGKYLIGEENAPAFYTANDKYNVYVSAFAGYNGGGNSSAMTTYVKVSFHISPIATAEE